MTTATSKAIRTAFESLNAPAPSLEEMSVELEYVFFGKIVDFSQLEQADSKEEQHQWEVRAPRSDERKYFGNFRVRKIDDEKYVLCMKVLQDGSDAKDEIELPADKDLFEATAKIATSGMRKTRYNFPVPDSDLVWEVDVYYDAEGKQREWCKIDLEVKKPLEKLPEFPIELTELFTKQPNQRTDDERAFVQKLMDEQFVLKNQYTK